MTDSPKVIPNIVGRIDAIVEAIRWEDWPKVERLLNEEADRRMEQRERRKREYKQAIDAYNAVCVFLQALMTSETTRAQAVREATR